MRTVLIDFDGVLHSYTSGWQGKANIPDAPNPGAIEFLEELLAAEDMEPVIWTSRVHCRENEDPVEAENAKIAIKQWLYLQGVGPDEVNRLKITSDKPPAVMLIDDRAFKFEGTFPTPDTIREFKPWNIKDQS